MWKNLSNLEKVSKITGVYNMFPLGVKHLFEDKVFKGMSNEELDILRLCFIHNVDSWVDDNLARRIKEELE